MQAISNRKHTALVVALHRLAALGQEGAPAQGTDGDIQSLCDTYRRYEDLLTELAACIAAYEKLHHYLKIHVLAPQLRQVRKQGKTDPAGYRKVLQ